MKKKKEFNGNSEQESMLKQIRPRVVVKFQDNTGLPYDETAAHKIEELKLGSWNDLQQQFGGIALRPLISSRSAEKIQELAWRGEKLDPDYQVSDRNVPEYKVPDYKAPDFRTYFAVIVPEGVESEHVAKVLNAWESVQYAYVEPMRVIPPQVDRASNPRAVNQGYLNPSPEGIDAEFAWGIAGGAGEGQALVDIEQGWTFNHEDLAAHNITLISGQNDGYFQHGTSVLGTIAAIDNTVGGVGITPEIMSIRCVSQVFSDGITTRYSTFEAIIEALMVMNPGDVLLLEAQTDLYGYAKVPVEIESVVFDAIRLATANNIIVVEAAGNGGRNLDTVQNPRWGQMFQRGNIEFKDSGAILVGAGSSNVPHARLGGSCYGSRIDCYAWGEYVYAPSTNRWGIETDLYTSQFDGTSSASAIIAGAALSVQGVVEAKYGQRITSGQMRAILSNAATGAVSANPGQDRIGVMPDLRSIITTFLS
jgi:subtilase family protein